MATLRLGLRVAIGPRRKSNVPGLQRLANHAHRILAQPVQVGLLAQPWQRTRPQGLCYVSTFRTTLVKKSQEGNGAFEHLRKLRPRIRVSRRVAALNPRPQLSIFPLPRSGLRSRCTPCRLCIQWQLPLGDLCLRALSCFGTLRSGVRSV
jgi:hypothetical protein